MENKDIEKETERIKRKIKEIARKMSLATGFNNGRHTKQDNRKKTP